MKKIILIGLILISENLYADTVTTGSIGLLKPTTGAIDTKRNSGDKLNSNFDMIAATITTALNSITALGNSSGTLAANVAASTNSIFTGNATTYAPAYATALSTANSLLNQSNTNYAIRSDVVISTLNLNSGSTVYSYFLNTSASTNSLQGQIYNIVSTNVVNGTLTGNDMTAGTIVSTTLAGTLAVSSFNASQFTSTGTASISGIKFGDGTTQTTAFTGGSPSGISKSTNSYYSVVIGTWAGRGADIVATVTNMAQAFRAAISTLGFTPYEAITATTVVRGTIFVQGGGADNASVNYTVSGTTIPSGVSVICEDGAVFINTGDNMMFTIYGRMVNPTIEITKGAAAAHGIFFDFKSGSIFDRFKFTKISLNDGGGGGVLQGVFRIVNSSNVTINDGIFSGVDDNTTNNTMRIFLIENSTAVYFRNNFLKKPIRWFGGNDFFFMKSGSDINITENLFESQGIFFHLQPTSFTSISDKDNNPNGSINTVTNNVRCERNTLTYFTPNQSGNANLFYFENVNTGALISSGCVIANNRIILRTTGSLVGVVKLETSASGIIRGVRVSGNSVSNLNAAAGTFFIAADSGVSGSIVSGNTVNGMTFISDSGVSTRYTSLGNFAGDLQQ